MRRPTLGRAAAQAGVADSARRLGQARRRDTEASDLDGLFQLIGSVFTLVIGLLLLLVFDLGANAAEYRLFGWVLVAIGVLGLVMRSWLERQQRRERSNPEDQPPR